jgi:hypothetical protein
VAATATRSSPNPAKRASIPADIAPAPYPSSQYYALIGIGMKSPSVCRNREAAHGAAPHARDTACAPLAMTAPAVGSSGVVRFEMKPDGKPVQFEGPSGLDACGETRLAKLADGSYPSYPDEVFQVPGEAPDCRSRSQHQIGMGGQDDPRDYETQQTCGY